MYDSEDKKDRNVIGNEIEATTIKNRAYPPFQTATVELSYADGIHKYAGILDLAITAGIVDKSGAWYSYKGERLGQGHENATEGMAKFQDKINKDIDKWLETTGYSTVSKEVKEAEEMIAAELEKEKVKE